MYRLSRDHPNFEIIHEVSENEKQLLMKYSTSDFNKGR